jgi:hypothetical protein
MEGQPSTKAPVIIPRCIWGEDVSYKSEKSLDPFVQIWPKSIHMTLVHSGSDFCVFLCGDVLDRRGDRRLIVEVGQLIVPGAVQVPMVYHIGHQLW